MQASPPTHCKAASIWPWDRSPKGWRRLFRGEAEAPTRFMIHIPAAHVAKPNGIPILPNWLPLAPGECTFVELYAGDLLVAA